MTGNSSLIRPGARGRVKAHDCAGEITAVNGGVVDLTTTTGETLQGVRIIDLSHDDGTPLIAGGPAEQTCSDSDLLPAMYYLAELVLANRRVRVAETLQLKALARTVLHLRDEISRVDGGAP
jgi:hypothetical protein